MKNVEGSKINGFDSWGDAGYPVLQLREANQILSIVEEGKYTFASGLYRSRSIYPSDII